MRIILAHNNYSVTGGTEVFYHDVARILKDNGHEVAFFSSYEDGLDAPLSEYFPSSADYKDGSLLARVKSFPKMVYSRAAKKAMERLIQDFKPDILHVFSIYVKLTPSILDAAHDAGIPIVMSCNEYKHICPNYKLYHHGQICEECKGGRFHRALVNRCCHNSFIYSGASMLESYAHGWMDIYRKNIHTFLFASKFMAQKTNEFWGSETFKYDILPNPFNVSKHLLDGPVGDYVNSP